MKSLVILISGRGSNMQALLAASLPAKVAAVISSRSDAPGLEIARQYGVETVVVDRRACSGHEDFDTVLAATTDRYQPDLVVLAGFMHILGERFVNRYQGRLMNIHPSLLPAFPGLDTHSRALREGIRIHGCTVHFVTAQLDSGPVVIQAAVPVLPDDTRETLSARVLQQEHRIYPQAVQWFLEDRLELVGGTHIRVTGNTTGIPDTRTVLYSPELCA